MKTNVASTSIDTYRDIRAEGKLTEQQKQVLATISPGRDYSLQEISLRTGLPINCVSGRVNELKKPALNRLVESKKRKCTLTGRTVMPVMLPTAEQAVEPIGILGAVQLELCA